MIWTIDPKPISEYFDTVASQPIDAHEMADKCLRCFGADHILTHWWTEHEGSCISKIEDESLFDEEMICAIDSGNLEYSGWFPGRRVPSHMGEGEYSSLSGSWLYGLADDESDFDRVCVAWDTIDHKASNSKLDPYVRTWTFDRLVHMFAAGERHAWELVFAPSDCLLGTEGQCKLGAVKRLAGNYISHVFDASIRYFDAWWPYFTAKVHHISDDHIRAWTHDLGWPWKLGYYMYVDAVLALHAHQSGVFDMRAAFAHEKFRTAATMLRKQKCSKEQWANLISPVLFDSNRIRQYDSVCAWSDKNADVFTTLKQA